MMLRKILGRIVPAIAIVLYVMQPALASAATGYATDAFLQMSDSRPDETGVTYQLTNTVSTTNAAVGIACVTVQIDTQADGGGGVPGGFDSTSASLNTTDSDYLSDWTGWSDDVSVNGLMTATKAATSTVPAGGSTSVVFDGVTNGSTASTTYFAIFKTFTDNGCSTLADTVTVALIYVNGQQVSLTVDPSLSFTIAGKNSGTACNGATTNVTTTNTTVPFGTVTSSANKIGAQDLTVGSNGTGGVYVYAWNTALLTNASDNTENISVASGTNAAPAGFSAAGTEAFGYTTSADNATGVNLADDRFGSNLWSRFITTANTDHVFFADSVPVDSTTGTGSAGNYAGGQFCVGYQVGISSVTAAGAYTNTVIYNAVPTY